jgi:phosphopantetheinyl transferase
MPQINHIQFNDTTIYLWQITETEAELLVILDEDMSENIKNHKSELHRKQLLARSILQKELDLDGILFKNEQGKPFLKNGKFISISHANHFVGIAISEQAIGIDIEKFSDKLTRIISKFLNKNEKNLANQLDEQQLLQIWTAKEGVYKLMGIPGLRFREDIEITELNQEFGKAVVQNDTKISLFFEALSNDVLICMAIKIH